MSQQAGRFWHKIKPNHSTQCPSSLCLIAITTTTTESNLHARQITYHPRIGYWVHFRLDSGKVSRRREGSFTGIVDLQLVLDSVCDPHRSTWIIASRGARTFRLSGTVAWWGRVSEPGSHLCIEDPPFVVRGRAHGCGVSLVDLANWWRADAQQLSSTFGVSMGSEPTNDSTESYCTEYARRECLVCERATLALVEFWRQHDLGVLSRTISGCAWNAWRHRFMQHEVVIHDNESAIDLERAAYIGGRCDHYFVGNPPGTVVQVDANSLYPYVMQTSKLPCKLVGLYSGVGVPWLKRKLGDFACVAKVVLCSHAHEYPVRCADRTKYVVGDFVTYLAGDELRHALREDHVIAVLRVALYQHADLFSQYVDYLYPLKEAYERAGEPGWRMLVKLLLNTLSGRMAMLSPRWVSDPTALPLTDWGMWFEKTTVNSKPVRYRSWAGGVQREQDRDEACESFPAIAACITANGRARMDYVKRICPQRSVYYQDNDGLLLASEALDHLSSGRSGVVGGLGGLREIARADHCRIFGPKDYELGEVSQIKGVKLGSFSSGFGQHRQILGSRAPGTIALRDATVYHEVESVTYQSRQYMNRKPVAQGWNEPWERFDVL